MASTGEPKGRAKKKAGLNVIMTCPKRYRCFEPATGKMYYEDELIARGVALAPSGKLVHVPTGAPLDPALIPLWNTSQQDEKGEWLYEGDFCEIDLDTGFGSLTERIGVMRWNVDRNCFSIHFNGGTTYSGEVTIKRIRKIGNEYQDKAAGERYQKDNDRT